jgi:NDP-sugar pyrophosphorylase family protein
VQAHVSNGPAATAVVHYAARNGMNGDRVAAPAGIYVFDRKAFDLVAASGFQDIKEHLLPALRRQGLRVAAYSAPEFSPRVLNAETYLAVNHWMIERAPAVPAIFEPWGPVSRVAGATAHPSATVHPTARIIGPAILGAGSSIGADAVVVGPTSIGADTVIGAGALVCRSVLWNGCHVGEHAFVDASVVGDEMVVAPGSTLQSEVRMNPARPRSWTRRLVSDAPAPQRVPARSLADLAVP